MSYLTHFLLFNHKETLAVYLLASVDGSDHPVWKHLSGKKKNPKTMFQLAAYPPPGATTHV